MTPRTARFADLDPATLYALLKLRCDVFVVEQADPYPDLDGRDTEPETLHLWFEDDGVPVAYARILSTGGTPYIGRVCTAESHRGTGLGGRLMQAALDAIGPDTPCALHAQTQATGLYEKFGFVAEGETFLDGRIEHVTMWRGLTADS
jgi:ElaA protein